MFYLENGRKELYQWDLDVCLFCQNPEISQAHFYYSQDKVLISEKKEDERGEYFKIPNILLQSSGNLRVYGYTPSYTTNEQQFVIRKRPKPDGYVYTETEVYDIQSMIDKSLEEAKESGMFDGGLSEWDYVIDKVEDFTTGKLDEMSGRVLVKGVDIYVPNDFWEIPNITIPDTVSVIKFIDSSIYAILTGTKKTKIIGIVGRNVDTGAYFTKLTGFGAVEFCENIDVANSDNVRHCRLREAINCKNLNDITSIVNYGDGIHHSFNNCDVIDNVRIYGREDEIIFGVFEFINCSHISNVYSVYPDVPIDYYNCTFVDGDTCDGYYTEEDEGKVKVVSLDGTLRTAEILIENGEGEQAIQSQGGTALGFQAAALCGGFAGSRGYRYKAIDTANRKIYLTKKGINYVHKEDPNKILTYDEIIQLDNNQKAKYEAIIEITHTGWSEEEVKSKNLRENFAPAYTVDKLFTLKTFSTDFDRVMAIQQIDNNVITYGFIKVDDQDVNPLAGLEQDVFLEVDVLPDRYSFSVSEQPDIGEVVITRNSFAIGFGSKGVGKYSIAIGANVMGYSDGAIAMGVDAKAGYQAIAMGELVEAAYRNISMGYNVVNKGVQSFAAGASLTIYENGIYSSVFGYQNKSEHRAVFMAGENLGYSKSDHQAIFGIRPNTYEGMALVVGNGTADKVSNAFVVWKDGRATIGLAPQNEMDVVNLATLRSEINRVTLPLRAGVNNSFYQVDCTATGQYSLALTKASKAAGAYACAIGYGAIVDKAYGISIGTQSECKSQNSVAIGHGVKTAAPTEDRINRSQTVLGRFNRVLDGADSNVDGGAVLIVGTGRQDTIRKNGLVVWADGRVTIGNGIETKDEAATKGYVDECISNIEIPESGGGETTGDWDYVIDKLTNFTTAKLATMSGRVLVKNINYTPEYDPANHTSPINVTIPEKLTHIEFVDSTIFATLTALSKTTKIVGFVGHNLNQFGFSALENFGWVEKCHGQVSMTECENIIHSQIRSALRCNNIQDVVAITDEFDGWKIIFNDCNTIDGVQINNINDFDDEESVEGSAEFVDCNHISNVRNLTPNVNKINYINCFYVDGDTCDGYYTEEDEGKVQIVNTSGEKSLISVVQKMTDEADYSRLYGVDETGAEETFYVDMGQDVEEGHIPRRNANWSIFIPHEPVEDTDAVNKAYVDVIKRLANQNALDIYGFDSRIGMLWESIEQINNKIGDISTILEALHSGGIE